MGGKGSGGVMDSKLLLLLYLICACALFNPGQEFREGKGYQGRETHFWEILNLNFLKRAKHTLTLYIRGIWGAIVVGFG